MHLPWLISSIHLISKIPCNSAPGAGVCSQKSALQSTSCFPVTLLRKLNWMGLCVEIAQNYSTHAGFLLPISALNRLFATCCSEQRSSRGLFAVHKPSLSKAANLSTSLHAEVCHTPAYLDLLISLMACGNSLLQSHMRQIFDVQQGLLQSCHLCLQLADIATGLHTKNCPALLDASAALPYSQSPDLARLAAT